VSLLWWSLGLVLIILSLILLFAALTGRDGVLQIGDRAIAEGKRERQTRPRAVRLSRVLLACIGLTVGVAIVVVLVF
jgi:amino acid transporter